MGNPKSPSEGGSGGKRGHSNMEHWGYTAEVKDAARVQRRFDDAKEVSSRLAQSRDSLRRFWFQLAGTTAFGVTAHSEREATSMARKAAARLSIPFEVVDVLRDVDLRTLDLPDALDPVAPDLHGVWHPPPKP